MLPLPAPSRGTCLPERGSILCRKPRASVCVCAGVSASVSLWVSARRRVAGLQCSTPCAGRGRAVRRGSTVAFFFLTIVLCQSCRLWHLWICRDLLCLHVPRVACPLLPQSDVCPPPAWTSPVLCFVPSATHRSVTIHVATENGWKASRRCRGRPWEGIRSLFRPHASHTPRSIFHVQDEDRPKQYPWLVESESLKSPL